MPNVNQHTDEDAKALSDGSARAQKRGNMGRKHTLQSQHLGYVSKNNHINNSQKSSSISNSKIRENKHASSMSSSQKNKSKKKERTKIGKIPR